MIKRENLGERREGREEAKEEETTLKCDVLTPKYTNISQVPLKNRKKDKSKDTFGTIEKEV